jgi:enamine deaminase RidA (YjgF/YER057c/UK114 family)
MSLIEKKLKELNIQIPTAPSPVGNYLAFRISGNKIYISGQLPIDKNGIMIKGKIGNELTEEDGKKAALLCMLNSIGHLKNAIKDLDKVKSCIKINGYINSENNFENHPTLLNSASDLLVKIFGEKGKHARAVVGVSSLPLNAAVEIETIFEIEN